VFVADLSAQLEVRRLVGEVLSAFPGSGCRSTTCGRYRNTGRSRTDLPRSGPSCHDGVMASQRFRAVVAAGPGDSAVMMVPFDPDEAWGAKASHPVSGTIGGCRIRARLVPAGCGWALTLAPKRLISMGIAIG